MFYSFTTWHYAKRFCFFLCLSVCLSVSLSLCLCGSLPVCTSVCLYIYCLLYFTVCLSLCLSVYLSFPLSVTLFASLPLCLFVTLLVSLSVFVCLSVIISVCLSLCLLLHLSGCVSLSLCHTHALYNASQSCDGCVVMWHWRWIVGCRGTRPCHGWSQTPEISMASIFHDERRISNDIGLCWRRSKTLQHMSSESLGKHLTRYWLVS